METDQPEVAQSESSSASDGEANMAEPKQSVGNVSSAFDVPRAVPVPRPIPRSRVGPSAPPFPGPFVRDVSSSTRNRRGKLVEREEVNALKKEVAALREGLIEFKQGLEKGADGDSCDMCDTLRQEVADLKSVFDEFKAGRNERLFETPGAAVLEDRKRSEAELVKGFQLVCQEALETEIGPVSNLAVALRADVEEAKREAERLQEEARERDSLVWKLKLGVEVVTAKVIKETTSYVWVIEDLPRLAFPGTRIDSNPFFTSSVAGYKLMAMLFPCGTGSGQRTHASVCWTLLPSECDDFLEWPFQQAVKFTLLPPPGVPRRAKPPIMASTPIGSGLPFQRPVGSAFGVGGVDPNRCEGVERFVTFDTFKSYVWPDGRVVLEVGVWPLGKVLVPPPLPQPSPGKRSFEAATSRGEEELE